MASSSNRHIRTYRASGAIAENTFVKFDTVAESVVSCGLNERAIGIAQTAALAAGDYIEVALPGGGAKLKLSMTIAKGKMLKSIAGGQGAVAAASGQWVGAIAYDDGVTNDVIDVMVAGFQAVADDT